ncbi:hypothetical protein U0070_010769 [Myodes glareolus]|uniref:Secreted protein n=1 Tax=Myodes glareolus TaxID=447135 RepID=A0AAW0H6R7_MYOGA
MSWNFVRGTVWMSCSSVTMAGLWVCSLWRGGQARKRNLRVSLKTRDTPTYLLSWPGENCLRVCSVIESHLGQDS